MGSSCESCESCETLIRRTCPFCEERSIIVERVEPVALGLTVNWISVLPLLPLVWLNCNHEEAELAILHWSLLVTVILDVPPSAGIETDVVETSNKGSTSSAFPHDVKVVTHKKAINIVLLRNLVFIFFIFHVLFAWLSILEKKVFKVLILFRFSFFGILTVGRNRLIFWFCCPG